ncbi:MAG: right-handed parallel beta-helix repeat-containing protein [Gammaproteobacteria bacterium]|nr:right-handed parallel beta-helix repeat-containing protein [Gammaproteobacteria bacterium]
MRALRLAQQGLGLLCGGLMCAAMAVDYRVAPSVTSECHDQLSRIVSRLEPGDSVYLESGLYTQTCNRNYTMRGTAARPVVIYADATEPAILQRPDQDRSRLNNLELVDSEYVVIRGLHFVGGSIGVRIMGGHHIVLENGLISDTGTTAIAINYRDTHHVTLRNNEITRTGLAEDAPGEGIYAGCHDGTCVVTDSLFEDNYIHDLRGDPRGGNDGIEIKVGSGGNIVRGNRIENTLINAQFPCIFVYGGGSRVNLIENNVLSRCGEAIQVAADAIVRNNIVYQASVAGILSAAHEQNPNPGHVYILNNTVIDAPVCAILDWRDSTHMVFANNALFCSATTALRARESANGLLLGNGWHGKLSGISRQHPGLFPLRTADVELEAPSDGRYAPAPDSRLKRRAIDLVPGRPANDFHQRPRNSNGFATVGAIE